MKNTLVHKADPHGGHFIVVRRVPPLAGEPEWVVVEDGFRGNAVAHFFSDMDAREYAQWRETPVAKPL